MSKNRLRWITLVRGPMWGIHSLTLMISCKMLIDWVRSGRTGKYLAFVHGARTSLRSVRTPWPRAKYFPVRPSDSVNKYIIKYNRYRNPLENKDPLENEDSLEIISVRRKMIDLTISGSLGRFKSTARSFKFRRKQFRWNLNKVLILPYASTPVNLTEVVMSSVFVIYPTLRRG